MTSKVMDIPHYTFCSMLSLKHMVVFELGIQNGVHVLLNRPYLFVFQQQRYSVQKRAWNFVSGRTRLGLGLELISLVC